MAKTLTHPSLRTLRAYALNLAHALHTHDQTSVHAIATALRESITYPIADGMKCPSCGHDCEDGAFHFIYGYLSNNGVNKFEDDTFEFDDDAKINYESGEQFTDLNGRPLIQCKHCDEIFAIEKIQVGEEVYQGD